jgi:hypothetical protein
MWPALSAAAFVTSVVAHALAMRFVRRTGAVAGFVAIGGVIGVVLIGYCGHSYGWTPATLAAILSYAFFCELYIFLFTLVGNSVSFGLMAKLANRPLTASEIAAFYRTEAMVARRLEQLERSNFVASSPAGPTLTPRGGRVVHLFSLLRSVFRRPFHSQE